ncbi:MAG: CHASE2 domain-containing protein [Geminicoccaceae bacterium]
MTLITGHTLRSVGIGLAVLLAASAFAYGLSLRGPIRTLENWTADLRMAWLRPLEPVHPEIVIIAITEDTLARFPYRAPINRAFLAQVIVDLETKNVSAIGLDVLIDQPSESAADQALQTTLNDAGVPVVGVTVADPRRLTERQAQFHQAFYRGLAVGYGDLTTDPTDGTIREQIAARDDEPKLSLAAALVEAHGGKVKGDRRGIVFRRGEPPFAVYPAETVGLLPAPWLAGKIALIGGITSLEDRHPTPLRLARDADPIGMPGVMVHAHQLAQLLEDQTLARPRGLVSLGLILIAAALGTGLVLLPVAWRLRLAATAALTILWIAGTALTFHLGGPMLPLVPPMTAALITVITAMAWAGERERQQRRFIRDAFGQYLAPSVVDQLTKQPERLKLGGERRRIAILFTDLADFTRLSEGLTPEQLTQLLNPYFDGLIDTVLEHEGTIDKIVGDALHVFFGAPQDQADYCERAFACALAIDRWSEAYRHRLAGEGLGFGFTRIGVHAGPVVVGNFGGAKRFDYTAHGDAVNTTARLESLNKHLGTRVCVSGAVVDATDPAKFRPVGDVILAGKQTPLSVFEPIELAGEGAHAYLRAYALMKAGSSSATRAFEELKQCYPNDPLAALHAGRLARGERGATIVLKSK